MPIEITPIIFYILNTVAIYTIQDSLKLIDVLEDIDIELEDNYRYKIVEVINSKTIDSAKEIYPIKYITDHLFGYFKTTYDIYQAIATSKNVLTKSIIAGTLLIVILIAHLLLFVFIPEWLNINTVIIIIVISVLLMFIQYYLFVKIIITRIGVNTIRKKRKAEPKDYRDIKTYE